jgi:hypothetical protein
VAPDLIAIWDANPSNPTYIIYSGFGKLVSDERWLVIASLACHASSVAIEGFGRTLVPGRSS